MKNEGPLCDEEIVGYKLFMATDTPGEYRSHWCETERRYMMDHALYAATPCTIGFHVFENLEDAKWYAYNGIELEAVQPVIIKTRLMAETQKSALGEQLRLGAIWLGVMGTYSQHMCVGFRAPYMELQEVVWPPHEVRAANDRKMGLEAGTRALDTVTVAAT